jgi:hypothetical protein
LVCIDCGDVLGDVPHNYDKRYVNGERCTYCGYETVKHSWKYDGTFYFDSHVMECTHCDSSRYEAHKFNSKGNCSVCGFHDPDVVEQETKPSETKPTETKPAEEKPVETKPAETEPTETKPAEEKPEETKPAETEPAETKPAETEPAETKPAETESTETMPTETEPIETNPVTTETLPENAGNEGSDASRSTWIWIAAGVAVICGFGAAAFFRKKKSS